ncbi:hypothetical protein GCM10007853_05350 [Algimonas ampicilliniresistens]|jgi:hypothetical protein|uniref:Uncharacterized protein n=1 Tax=Algimonas ampicilliniresistens TaxID=1298735 RepID=A0ABQ5V561_9PROT|nr:hypothetical protein [Algimonas ampicilliniresistens]GLQ22661.1 hypothetical protein GCM10007853_05350 [Algimonas ampicilliniresistens]
MTARQFEDYHGYTIVHNKSGARLLTGDGSLANPETFKSLDGAKQWIDDRLKDLKGDRRAAHIGTVDGYVDALTTQGPSKHEGKMLAAHAVAPDRRMTPQQLADVAGWKRYSSANTHYGKLGKRFAEQLNLEISEDNNHAWTRTIGEYDDATSEWIMHEELAQAVEQLKIR